MKIDFNLLRCEKFFYCLNNYHEDNKVCDCTVIDLLQN